MKTKIISIILTIAVLFSLTQTVALAQEDAITIKVDFSATSDEIIVPLEELTVTDGTAESYGYTVSKADHNGKSVDGVTAFDVLVAAHAKYYGDAFTAETASEYLAISDGFLIKAFGKNAAATGFAINNETPHDDILTDYGYTGYAWDTAVVESGDSVQLYFYQDTRNYSDIIAFFTPKNTSCHEGGSITYSLTGYSVAYFGCSDKTTIAENARILAGIDVYMKKDSEETFTKIGTTDENGLITVTFEKIGSYTLYAAGKADGNQPVIASWSKMTCLTDSAPHFPIYNNMDEWLEIILKAFSEHPVLMSAYLLGIFVVLAIEFVITVPLEIGYSIVTGIIDFIDMIDRALIPFLPK